jgi:hypothetical protein
VNTRPPLSWRLHASAAAFALPVLMELTSFGRLERRLTALASRRLRRIPDDRVAARWVDDALYGRPHPWTRTCLRRATVLYYLLRRGGRNVELCIGVRRDEQGELKAHAWLLHEGMPYLEPMITRDEVSSYGTIARFPSLASAVQ